MKELNCCLDRVESCGNINYEELYITYEEIIAVYRVIVSNLKVRLNKLCVGDQVVLKDTEDVCCP